MAQLPRIQIHWVRDGRMPGVRQVCLAAIVGLLVGTLLTAVFGGWAGEGVAPAAREASSAGATK